MKQLSRAQRGIVVCLVHLLLVSSLGAKLLADRARLPKVWVKTLAYDPDLPVRGRYVSLRLVVQPQGLPQLDHVRAKLQVIDGKLVAGPEDPDGELVNVSNTAMNGANVTQLPLAEPFLTERVAFYLAPGVPDPSRRPADEELWAEVTLPRHGAPRPIRLGVRSNGGEIRPLNLR